MNINHTKSSNKMHVLADVSESDCIILRFIAVIFTGVSIISLVFNIRFIIFDRNRLNPLALSLIINSFALVFVSLPYVIAQGVRCYPVQSFFICSFQGFTCFTCGICVMYSMSLLALIQYIKLFYNTCIIYRIIEHRRSYLIPFICWFIAFLWSIPPFLGYGPAFIREGAGFDCGLNWKHSAASSRAYLFLAFILIYFIPLFLIVYTNIRILLTIRQLIQRRYSLVSNTVKTMPMSMRHRLMDMFTVAESNRLKRLRIDRRFAKATLITVIHYLLAWTPYTVCGLIQMFSSMNYITYQPPSIILAASALTAKMAVIGQSAVYFFTVRPTNRRFSLTSATLK